MILHDFREVVASAESLRKRGEPFGYPHRKVMYRQVLFSNQAPRFRDGAMILPCGKAGYRSVRIPKGVTLPRRLREVRLRYGEVELVCAVLTEPRPAGPTIGIDLGVNAILAAADGDKAILVSGREIKATIQLRNKRLAAIGSKRAKKTKRSRRHKRLQRAKSRMLARTRNKVRDLCHKATRKVADAFPDARAYVGEPFNDACQKIGRGQAQTVSSACSRKIIDLLDSKLAACIAVEEHDSSQTCPVCGERSKHARTYRCRRCGYVAPRDVVGCTNIRTIGIEGGLRPGCPVPDRIQFVHPPNYPGPEPGSPADIGHVARERSREAAGLEPERSVTPTGVRGRARRVHRRPARPRRTLAAPRGSRDGSAGSRTPRTARPR
ncbi:MAG: transposase [Planctomycetaceae bacterium]|nr:transposase [Planctomycetaceae bacterium]